MRRFGTRRRRRGARRSTPMAGSPFDLFLDAVTNMMGVVMFILLMVVLFGRSRDAVPIPDVTVAEQVRVLQRERDDLLRAVAALPPAGDPEQVARWRAAVERVEENRVLLDDLRRTVLERTLEVEARRTKLRMQEEALRAQTEEVRQIEARVAQTPPAFVRVGVFRADPRRAVLLTLAGGRLGRPSLTSQTPQVEHPTGGASFADGAGARAVLARLLAGSPPATHRVELAVWEDSFGQAGMVEQAILEMGYDTNPLPVRNGQALMPGTGGVQ